MRQRIEKTLIRRVKSINVFNSWHKIKDNFLILEKREALKFLSFFYESLFLNPNPVFGFFLTKKCTIYKENKLW